MIKLNNIDYQYDNLNMQFDFSIKVGERVAVMGPSGAGKVHCLALLVAFNLPKAAQFS